jgi:hypothetical protein
MFKPFLDRAGMSDLEKTILADLSVTVEAASAKLLTHLGANAESATPVGAVPHIQMLENGADLFRADASAALLVRAGLDKEGAKNIRANPLRGHKLLDLARASLERINVDTRGMGQMEIVAAAFTQERHANFMDRLLNFLSISPAKPTK